jgi:hypothetical protein
MKESGWTTSAALKERNADKKVVLEEIARNLKLDLQVDVLRALPEKAHVRHPGR